MKTLNGLKVVRPPSWVREELEKIQKELLDRDQELMEKYSKKEKK